MKGIWQPSRRRHGALGCKTRCAEQSSENASPRINAAPMRGFSFFRLLMHAAST